MKTVHFEMPLEDGKCVLDSLKSYLSANGYVIQEFLKQNGMIIQVRKGGGFRKILGLSAALNMTVDLYDSYFTVSFSEGKWADKAAVAGVSLFVLWPLLITSAVGAYKQAELPNKIIEFLNSEVSKQIVRKKSDLKNTPVY